MTTDKSLAFVFPGQGSQSVGMLKDVATEFPLVETVFAQASKVLGYDLWKLVQTGPAEELDKTIHTQPALLAASYALWQIATTKNKSLPAFLAGHSLGEYTALVCGNSIAFDDAVRLVSARGHYMQAAVPAGQGGLAALINLTDEVIENICREAVQAGETLSIANYNSPGQTVVAGHIQAVERAIVLAKAAGARLAKLLPVSVPSHCSLMKPAAEKLAKMLDEISIQVPSIPVVNNVDVKVYDSVAAIRQGLMRQLFMPVRWVEIIRFFAAHGITHIVECGPGKVLNGLNKRIVENIQLTNVADNLCRVD